MNKLEQAARQALEALELGSDRGATVAHKVYAETKAITALREALAEQAEQEPDYFGLTHDHTWLSIEKKQYDKLKPEGRMACYAAPVRTKDLTDDELADACGWKLGDPMYEWVVDIGRWAIAADREKNK